MLTDWLNEERLEIQHFLLGRACNSLSLFLFLSLFDRWKGAYTLFTGQRERERERERKRKRERERERERERDVEYV
jgi:hypothetical protein